MVDSLLPYAKDLRKQAATREEERADEFVRLLTEAELEKRAFVEVLGKASDGREDDAIRLASAIIQRAAQSGLFEVQILRFSNELCTDGGQAIGNEAAGWEKTLTGVPQGIYRFWSEYLRPRGYLIRYSMSGVPHSQSGDVSIVMSWEA